MLVVFVLREGNRDLLSVDLPEVPQKGDYVRVREKGKTRADSLAVVERRWVFDGGSLEEVRVWLSEYPGR